jgi:hypothetical protein
VIAIATPHRHIANPQETAGAVTQPPHRHIEVSQMTAGEGRPTANKGNPPAPTKWPIASMISSDSHRRLSSRSGSTHHDRDINGPLQNSLACRLAVAVLSALRTESGATRVTRSVTGSVTTLLHRGRRNRLCNSAVTPPVSARFTVVLTAFADRKRCNTCNGIGNKLHNNAVTPRSP